MSRSSSPAQVRGLLAALAALASLLALKALIWPRWPTAAPLDRQAIAAQLTAQGFASTPLAALPARSSYERATSEAPGFAIGEGETLRLMRGSIRERLALQLALVAASDPLLKLRNRQLIAGPPPAALGQNGSAQVRQTCLVGDPANGGGYGVTGEQLLNLVDRLPSDRMQRIQTLIGTRLPRDYSCVLISVSGKAGGTAIEEARWQRLLEALRPALIKGKQGG